MSTSDWLSIIALVVSVVSLVTNIWSYTRMTASQIDDNIMNEVNSVVLLLEKTKSMSLRERAILANLLNEWDYFTPPSHIMRMKGPKPSPATINELRQYFKELGSSGEPGSHH